MSLPLRHRLRHRKDFSRVYANGLRCSSKHLTIRALRQKSLKLSDRERGCNGTVAQGNTAEWQWQATEPDAVGDVPAVVADATPLATLDETSDKECHLPPTQIGISISQKVSKQAVVRNRLKRQIKAAFRQLLPHISPGWMIVVVVRPSAIRCDYWQFLQELEQTLTMIEVIDGHS